MQAAYTQTRQAVELGDRIRQGRTSLGLSQPELAQYAGLSPDAIDRIELGEMMLTLAEGPQVLALVETLGHEQRLGVAAHAKSPQAAEFRQRRLAGCDGAASSSGHLTQGGAIAI